MSAYERIITTIIPNADAIPLHDLEALAADITLTLTDPTTAEFSSRQLINLLRHIGMLYSITWHSSSTRIAMLIIPHFKQLSADPAASINDLAEIYDALLFLFWSNTNSIDEQRSFGSDVVTPFANRLRVCMRKSEQAGTRQILPRSVGKLRVAYHAQFCNGGQGNALAICALDILSALNATGSYEVFLYAWRYHDEAFLAEARERGVQVRTLHEPLTHLGRSRATARAMRGDGIDVIVTDMNSVGPTLLFAQRAAPVQIYYQFGLPFWPASGIDAVFLGWHIEPARLGFDDRICTKLELPWDLSSLAPAIDPAVITAERAMFPPQSRIIGTYGRLVKITDQYLAGAIAVLRQHDDVVLALGGVGDARHIREYLAAHSDITARVVIVDRFVNGHVWGQFLDVFIDTWPLQAGYAGREVMAKGVPVVSVYSADMPNLGDERDLALRAHDSISLTVCVNRLLNDHAFAARCRSESLAIAQRFADRQRFSSELDQAIRKAVQQKTEEQASI